MSRDIIKAGWIQRQTSVLKRWKENWFVLFKNGTLMYFVAENSAECERKIQLKSDCLYIRGGNKVTDVTPPTNRSPGCLLSLKLREGEELNLCAQSTHDRALWLFSLEGLLTSQPQQHRPLGLSKSYTEGKANTRRSQDRIQQQQQQQRVVYPPSNSRSERAGVTREPSRRLSLIPSFLRGQTFIRRHSIF